MLTMPILFLALKKKNTKKTTKIHPKQTGWLRMGGVRGGATKARSWILLRSPSLTIFFARTIPQCLLYKTLHFLHIVGYLAYITSYDYNYKKTESPRFGLFHNHCSLKNWILVSCISPKHARKKEKKSKKESLQPEMTPWITPEVTLPELLLLVKNWWHSQWWTSFLQQMYKYLKKINMATH